jgi:hypothetical protein
MAGIRQFVRPEITASAIVHLSIVALLFAYAEGRPLGSLASQSVTVDVVTPDEIEKKAEPAVSPQLPTDLGALAQPAETPVPLPAVQPASPPLRQAARSTRKDAAVRQQPEPSSAQSQPQTQTPQSGPTPASSAPTSSGYMPPEPDVTVKYRVPLGLPEALPAAVLSVDVADKKSDSSDDAPKVAVAADAVTAFRARIKLCAKLPPSLSPSDDLMIKLRILMTRDGRLAAEPMVKEGTASLKAVDLRDSAVAALSACQPYTMLPPEKYNEWKVIDVTFTPRDFSS